MGIPLANVNPTDTTAVALTAAVTGAKSAASPGVTPEVISLIATNDHATNDIYLLLLDGTTEIARFFMQHAGAPLVIPGTKHEPAFGSAYFTAGNAAQVKLSGAGSVRVVAKVATVGFVKVAVPTAQSD